MSSPPRNSASLYVVNAGSSVLTTIIRMTVLMWVSQYLLRRVAPEEYALIPIIASLLTVAELFPTIFLRGLSRFMVEADACGDGDRLSSIVSSMAPILATVAIVLFAGGVFAAVQIDSIIIVDPAYRTDAQIMLLMLMALLCVTVATTPFRVGLFVRMRFVEQNLILLGTETLRVLLLLTLLFGVSTRALWVAVASSAANLVHIIILVAYTAWILPHARFRWSMISGTTIRLLMSFSLWTLVQGFNNLVLQAVPALLLNRHAAPIDVVSFQIGNLADVQIRKLVISAMAPAGPALTTVYAKEGESALRDFYYMGGRYYLWVTLFLLPPLLAFAYPLIDLYVGARYAEAGTVMILVLGAYPLTWASAMFYQIAYAVGRIRSFNVCSVFLGVITLGSIWYFVAVRDMGATGAAIGLGAGYGLTHLIIIWPFGLRLVGGSWSVFLLRTLLPGVTPFAAALAICFLYGWFLPIDSWAIFFAGCALSALLYVAVLFGVCLSPQDKRLVSRAYKKIIRRLRPGKGPKP